MRVLMVLDFAVIAAPQQVFVDGDALLPLLQPVFHLLQHVIYHAHLNGFVIVSAAPQQVLVD